jgi:hypothetical protein
MGKGLIALFLLSADVERNFLMAQLGHGFMLFIDPGWSRCMESTVGRI